MHFEAVINFIVLAGYDKQLQVIASARSFN
jgi:hypothetical protein